MELIIATTNRGKFLEIQNALEGLPLKLSFLGDFSNAPKVDEDQSTFEGNALKKAREIARWSGKSTLADDSGLVVPSLKGEPGIYSARYAGPHATDEDNVKKLLNEMQSLPDAKREAFFVCVLAVVTPSGREFTVEGRCDGTIGQKPQGLLGFGYDPVFYIPSLGKTMAELPLEEKNQISHRGRALRGLQREFEKNTQLF